MSLTEAAEHITLDALRGLARCLDTTPHGERGAPVAEFAAFYGLTVQTVYRRLKKVGWNAGRKRRADAGTSSQPLAAVHDLAAATRNSVRKNGKVTLETPTARSVFAVNGRNFAVGNSRLNQILRRELLAAAQQKQARPWQPQRSLHPNHVHQVDPSLCLIYYLPDGGQAVLHDDEIYKNKPENIERLGDLKVWRYVLADHYSHTIQVRYYQAKGETQANLFDFLLYCWARREGRVFHGVPQILLWDKGSANQAQAIKNALRALSVRDISHTAGNPRAKGSVEVANNLVETKFESRLRLEPVANVAALNAAAAAWSEAFNSDCLPQYDARLQRDGMREPVARYALWQTIRQEQLRILPDEETCRYLLSADPVERPVRPDLTVRFRHPVAKRTLQYDLAHIPHVYPRCLVRVAPLVYGEHAVIVYCRDYQEAEHTYIVAPLAVDERSGFRLDAAVIGAEFKSQPDTRVEHAGKAADRRAFPDLSQEEIQRAKARNVTPFAGQIDAHSHLAHIVPPAAFLRRPGTELTVPNRAAQETRPLTITEACKRLLAELGQRSDVNYYMLLARDYPQGITEADLDALINRFRGNTDQAAVPINY